MTNGQIQQLRDLSKCSNLTGFEVGFVDAWLNFTTEKDRMRKEAKHELRRLTHQYRHQIKAIKRNQAL